MKILKISNKGLLRGALMITLIGILIIISLNILLEPKLIGIGEIADKSLNKNVKVQGIIFNIRSYEDSNFQVLSIEDETGKIDITTNEILNLSESNQITVIGKIKEYNLYLQIQADKILVSNTNN